jgi:Flp pilus assembly pilin Flp
MTSSGALGRDGQRLRGDGGASLVEYALLVALILVVAVSAVRYFQANVTQSFSESSSSLDDAY